MSTPELAPAPETVLRMSAQAREFIAKAIEFDVDGTQETLPVVDHYLNGVPGDKPEICSLVASATGCYFGEIVRERFGGAWVTAGDDPTAWRLEITGCTLSFFPVGMAYQAILRGDNEDLYDDGVYVEQVDKKGLAEALDRTTRVTPEVYYTLCNRFDTLEYIIELLMGRRAKEKEERENAE